MEWKYVVILTILLVSVMSMAGCTSSPQATVATPPPVSAAATQASAAPPSGAPSVAAPPEALTMVQTTVRTTVPAPVPDHPYSKTYTFEGTGDYTQEFTTDSDRTWVFRMDCPNAKEIFMATIKDANFDDVEELANEAGAYSGTMSVRLAAGKYYLDVAADSPWTITMSTA